MALPVSHLLIWIFGITSLATPLRFQLSLARVSLNSRKRARRRRGYFKHHRVTFGKIEIKNASTPAQIMSCQLALLSAKATATIAGRPVWGGVAATPRAIARENSMRAGAMQRDGYAR